MKTHSATKLRLFIVVLLTSLSSWQAKANEFPPIDKTFLCETVDEWTEISQISGITISYSLVRVEDERFLSIQFENTNNQDVDFIWTLLNQNSAVTITTDGMIESIVQLASNETKIVNGTYLIEMKSDEDFSDFVVLIKPNKR